MQLIIRIDGTASCVYGESIDLSALGQLRIRRASHVEPTEDGRWMADMAPVGGPQLGPFATRSEALAKELAWLLPELAVNHDLA